MTKPRDPDALLSAYLAVGMEVLPDRVVDSVLDEVHRTRQRRALWPVRRTRHVSRTTSAAALVVAVVALGGVFFVVQRGQPVVAGPHPTASAIASPSLPAVVVPSATPATTPSPEVTPPAALPTDLTWTKVALDGGLRKVAWLGDRFVLLDDSGAVSTSSDGAGWQALRPGDPDPGYAELLKGSFASWRSDVVGWWNPGDGPDIAGKPPTTARDVVRIIRPPAEPAVTTPFKGRIESIGIGPKGIVVQVHSHLDWDAWVASKLGNDWVSRYKGVDFKNGILEITMKRGRGLKVVWADEGFAPGDYMDAGFEWFSPDGEHWTAVPAGPQPTDGDGGLGFPTGFGDVVGVSDGFIARGVDSGTACASSDGCAGIWHSADGVTWRHVGNAPNGRDVLLVPWMGGALVTDGVGRFDLWTADGSSKLPMTAGLPADWKRLAPEGLDRSVAIGPLGLVTVLKDHPEVLVTRDGVNFDIRPMPAEMAADQTSWRSAPTVAVGDRSVLVVMWAKTDSEKQIPTLWLGTFAP